MTEAIVQPQQPAAQPSACAEPEPQLKTGQRYKCHTCHTILYESELVGEKKTCPDCGESFSHLQKMCRLDHCNCSHEITSGIAYCPECGMPVCKECGCHDVIQVSRVTGYMSTVQSWNNAKQAEFRDRIRYTAT